MLKIGVLVSGGGTNLQAIIDSIESGYITNAKIVTVISGNPDAYALERAKKHDINGVCIRKKDYLDEDDYLNAMAEHLDSLGVELIVLAGFMTVLGKKFIDRYKNKIINIHPALLPSFCGDGFYGLRVHKAALDKGVKVTGATGVILLVCSKHFNHSGFLVRLKRRWKNVAAAYIMNLWSETSNEFQFYAFDIIFNQKPYINKIHFNISLILKYSS